MMRLVGVSQTVNFVTNWFLFVFMAMLVRRHMSELTAGMAVISNCRANNHADVLHVLREAGRVKHSFGNGYSSIRKDSQVNLGTARHRHCSCSQRRVNQIRTDFVSCYTLLIILEKRSEQVYVCPMCNDDDISTNEMKYRHIQ
jgi:hypothetical protein